MNAAELLVHCLENEGVDYVFGIPGEENIHIMDALAQSRIRFVTTRHEQGAAFMADVYGRLTGRAGVCLATLGPGATNLITGVADASAVARCSAQLQFGLASSESPRSRRRHRTIGRNESRRRRRVRSESAGKASVPERSSTPICRAR